MQYLLGLLLSVVSCKLVKATRVHRRAATFYHRSSRLELLGNSEMISHIDPIMSMSFGSIWATWMYTKHSYLSFEPQIGSTHPQPRPVTVVCFVREIQPLTRALAKENRKIRSLPHTVKTHLMIIRELVRHDSNNWRRFPEWETVQHKMLWTIRGLIATMHSAEFAIWTRDNRTPITMTGLIINANCIAKGSKHTRRLLVKVTLECSARTRLKLYIQIHRADPSQRFKKIQSTESAWHQVVLSQFAFITLIRPFIGIPTIFSRHAYTVIGAPVTLSVRLVHVLRPGLSYNHYVLH